MRTNFRSTNFLFGCGAACALALVTALAGAPGQARQETGTVATIDPQTRVLTVKEAGGAKAKTIQWNSQTRFTAAGKAANASGVKAGDRVQIHYAASGDKALASRIEVKPKSTSHPPTKARKPAK